MIQVERLAACPLCASGDISYWGPAFDRFYGVLQDPLRYSRCSACDLVFLSSRASADTVAELYPDEYDPYQSTGAVTNPLVPRGRIDRILGVGPADWRKLVVSTYESPPRGGGRLLDFGCGSPDFALRAASLGWTVTATDFSPAVVASVRTAGIEAYHVDEFSQDERITDFDVIRMNHVLEHLYDPTEALLGLRARLARGGVLHLAVPNPAGLSARLFGKYWWALEPRHIMLFSPRRLRRTLRESGFGHVDVRHEESPRDGLRSLEQLLAEHWSDGRFKGLVGRWSVYRAWVVVAHVAALSAHGDRLHAVASNRDG